MSSRGDIAELTLVGAGHIALVAALPALQSIPGVRVVNVIDLLPEAGGKVRAFFPEAKYYSRIEEVDVGSGAGTYIATPVHRHFEILKALSYTRTKILCEKPLLHTMADFESIRKLSGCGGLNVSVVLNRLHEVGVQVFIDQVRERLGPDVEQISYRHHMTAPFDAWDTSSPQWRLQSPSRGGGVRLDLAFHAVYLGEALTGTKWESSAIRDENQDSAKLTFANACSTMDVDVSWAAPVECFTITARSRGNEMAFTYPESIWYGKQLLPRDTVRETGLKQGYRAMFEQWLGTDMRATNMSNSGFDNAARLTGLLEGCGDV